MKGIKGQTCALKGASTLAVITAALIGTSAYADEAPSQDGTGEIYVVARKRTEVAEKVPVSVGVMSDEDLARLSIKDVADYTRQTPGAILIGSGPEYLNDIALRGQGGGRLGFSESSTGIYRDGIFVAGGGFGGRSYSKIDFYDVDRIEVYRGPQGALYGRNAVGGAVNVISRKPVLDTEVRGKIGYDSVDELDTSLTLNLPVSATAAIRVGGYYTKQTGGFYKDAVTGNIIDKSMDWGVRGTIGVGIKTDTSATLTIEHSHSEAPGFTALGQNLKLDPDPFVRTGLDSVDQVTIDQTQMIAEFSHDFGASELTLLANYKGRDGVRSNADFDHYLGINLPTVQLYDAQSESFNRFGTEARWGSTAKDGFTWLAGADFMTFVSDVTSPRTGTVTGSNATAITLKRQLRLQKSREELNSFSVYGQLGFDLTSQLKLSIEARFQVDHKDFRFQQIDLDPTTNEAIPLSTFTRRWQRFLPTASLTYTINPQLTVYGRVATGYRPGGFNQNPAEGYFDRVPYNPEDITSGEIGAKGHFRLGAINFRSQLSLYYSVSRGVQQTTTLTQTNPAFTLENVGTDDILGGEFELTGTVPLAGGRLVTGVNVSGEHGNWRDGASIINAGVVIDLSGKATPRARDYIINLNAMYDHPVTGSLDAMFTASYQTAYGGYDDASLTRPSSNYSIVDLSAGIKTRNWTLMAYVKNLTDKIYRIVTVGGNNYYNTPRTYGASFSFNW